MFILEAHKGVDSERPENTMAAYRLAVEQGYGMIELDTKFTADGACVLLHDGTLNRTARLPDGRELPAPVAIHDIPLAVAKTYDLGLARGPAFAGERIPTLDEVLDFTVPAGIPIKIDNVFMRHTPAERAALYDIVERHGALELCGFTSNSVDFIANDILARFPGAFIHYDGDVSEEVLERLHALVRPGRLTVWLRYDNPRSSWCTTRPVDEAMAALVKKYAKLGIWILDKPEECVDAAARFAPDIIETDGTVKPDPRFAEAAR